MYSDLTFLFQLLLRLNLFAYFYKEAMSTQLVTNSELAKKISRCMDPNLSESHFSALSNHSIKVFEAIGRLISYMFQSANHETNLVTVDALGTFMRNCSRQFDFFPSAILIEATKISRSGTHFKDTNKLQEPVKRQELGVGRLAAACKITEVMCHGILLALSKAIVSNFPQV